MKTCGTCHHSAFVKRHRMGYCCNKGRLDKSVIFRKDEACSHHEEKLP